MSPDEALSAGDRIKLWAWATLSQTPEAKLVLKLDGRLTMAEGLLAHRASGEGGSTSALRASAPEGQEARLPCPFCGCASYIHSDSRADFGTTVGCSHCSARTDECATVAEAIEAWNRRTPTPTASVEAGPSRGASAPLAPEALNALEAERDRMREALKTVVDGIYSWERSAIANICRAALSLSPAPGGSSGEEA